jgi:hypothetical protein
MKSERERGVSKKHRRGKRRRRKQTKDAGE